VAGGVLVAAVTLSSLTRGRMNAGTT